MKLKKKRNLSSDRHYTVKTIIENWPICAPIPLNRCMRTTPIMITNVIKL